MKKKILLLALCFVTIFSGCRVISFFPFYTPDDIIVDDRIIGEWMMEDEIEANEKGENSDKKAYGIWRFQYNTLGSSSKPDSTNIQLTFPTCKGWLNNHSEYEVRLFKLGNNTYLDFYLEELEPDLDIDIFTSFHLMPVHTLAKVELGTDTIKIKWMDDEWLDKMYKENKVRIQHLENEDRRLLTASSKELKRFLLKYGDDPEAFDDEEVLVKLK